MDLPPFQTWLLSCAPTHTIAGVVAYNFNMAEPTPEAWSVELVGADWYDVEDSDWSCPPKAWSSRPHEFLLPRTEFPTWESAQQFVIEEVRSFLELSSSEAAKVLRESTAVCAGFVDGELSTIWPPDWPN